MEITHDKVSRDIKVPSYRDWFLESVVAILVVGTPPLALVAVVTKHLYWGTSRVELLVFLLGYALTMMGLTMGFHRLFTHRSFRAHPALAMTLGILGSTAMQGPIVRWVADHRRHHKYADTAWDPHSPRHRRGGAAGLWHAYWGWFFSRTKTRVRRFAPDLIRDPTVVWIDRNYWLWAVLGLVGPAFLVGLIEGCWLGFLGGFLWGGVIRFGAVCHATWLLNAACHRFGKRTFSTKEESTNNGFVNLLVFGEGWHNNHHAFPSSARHGLGPNQCDLTYQMIRAFERLGLARDIRIPDATRIEQRR